MCIERFIDFSEIYILIYILLIKISNLWYNREKVGREFEDISMSHEKPTMKDVARLAGVSQPTVSYVINGSASISNEVKARVNDAIKQLNYKPNYFAKALKTNSSEIVGIIIPDILNQYYARLLQLLEEDLHAKNYQVIIYSTAYNGKIEETSVRQLLSYNVHAIIALYQFTNKKCWDLLKGFNHPVVAIEGGAYCASLGIPCINVDSHLGGYMATRHLLSLGKKRIAYIQQNSDIEVLEERCDGYIEAMKAAGLYQPTDIFVTKNPNDKWNEGKILGKKLALHPYDGIIASSDLIAVGIIKELQRSGKQVPEEVAVIGYDDVPIAELFIPALTTVAQPLEEICALAMEIIFNSENRSDLMHTPMLQPKLVKRESA